MTEKYEWDIRCADMELRRLEEGFTGYDFTNFARILLQGFQRVVSDIHIETGSLLSSSRVEVLDSTPGRWEGEIKVGGDSAGVNNPVRYAASELFGTSPKHGGPPSHDYLRHLDHIDEDLLGPATSFISRGRRTPHPEAGAL